VSSPRKSTISWRGSTLEATRPPAAISIASPLVYGEDAMATMTNGLSRRIHHGEFTLKRNPQ
jgi:hypothetical protein